MLLAVLEFELGGLVGESQRGGVIGVDIVDLVGEFGAMVFFSSNSNRATCDKNGADDKQNETKPDSRRMIDERCLLSWKQSNGPTIREILEHLQTHVMVRKCITSRVDIGRAERTSCYLLCLY